MLIVVGAPNLPSPPRSDALQPSEKETLEDARFSRFLAREESPQWNALHGLMQQATTLVAFRRLAADPEAMRTAEALRTRATTEPKMLSVLSDQARRIRADPQLMAMMSAMQRVLADPRAPLPSAAGDGLPMPKMDLAELLATEQGRARLHALAARTSTDPQLRERMQAILQQPRVRQRLWAMQDDIVEKPAIWGSLLRAIGSPANATNPSAR